MRSNFGSALSGVCLAGSAQRRARRAGAAEPDLRRARPGPSGLRQSGMVATQEAEASRIGLEVLQNGGNAVDAAATVAFALAVTLPQRRQSRRRRLHAGARCRKGRNGRHRLPREGRRQGVPRHVPGRGGRGRSREVALQRSRGRRARHRGGHGVGAGALRHDQPRRGARARDRARRAGYHGERGSGRFARGAQDRLRKWPSSTTVFYKDGGVPYRAGRDPGAGRSREPRSG